LPEEVAAGIDDSTRRTTWNAVATATHALPAETWREVIARRGHHDTIRTRLAAGDLERIPDLVALNVNLKQLALDLIETCDSPALLRDIYGELESLSVLDPTCGSGAFLFAALNIFEPLYEAALERMAAFLADADAGNELEGFTAITTRVEGHPNRTFF